MGFMTTKKRRIFVATAIALAAIAGMTLVSGHAESPSAEGAPDELFERAVNAIDRNYIDPDRIDPPKMLDGALDQMQLLVPEIMVRDKDAGQFSLVVGLAEKRFRTGAMSSISDLKRVMREALDFIAGNYHGDTPKAEIEYAAIDGMLEVLDPHSNFMPPKVYNEFQVGTRGKFGGLGIVISIKDGNLSVIAPIEGTPASRADIRAGDRILQIDDESTINMSLTDAVNRLRGDVGTKVQIVVERPGHAARRIVLTRAIINIDSVQHQLLAEGGKRIGYLKVKSFQSNTNDDVQSALKEFHAGNAKLDGLILDMRNNPGGLLNEAVDLADHFLDNGIIVTTVGPRDQVLEKENAHSSGTEGAYPIVVLVNEGSASASEIVAGALQSNDRAVVMGGRSFGKGSVQTIIELGGGSAIKLTIAQYKPAGTQVIQLAGVTPDIELQPVTVAPKAVNLVEDELPSELDLESHLEGKKTEGAAGLPRSPYHIRYLVPKEDEKESEARSVREYAKELQLEKDFMVGLAKKLVAEAGNGSRKAMLDKAASTIGIAEKGQDAAIAESLKSLGIDWANTKAQGDPKLTLAYHLKQGNVEVSRARAGEKIDLQLSATNGGSGTYSRLIALGKSDMPFLLNREFPFGRLSPGATRTWNITMDLPEGLPRQDLSMDVTFEEENGRKPEPLTIVIPMDELPEPTFSFALHLPPGTKGKPFAKSASIPLTVDVSNIGSGTSSAETTAAISNECGDKLFIEKGRVKLGALKAGAMMRAPFRFHFASDPGTATCQLKLTIADTKRFIALSKKIDLFSKDGGIKPPPDKKYDPPIIGISKFETSTAAASAEISGTIKDSDSIRDYFVFVGDKKIAYVPNSNGGNSVPFKISLPLEPGSNQIAIGARDEQNLMGKKIIVIDRISGEKKKDRRSRAMMFGPGVQP